MNKSKMLVRFGMVILFANFVAAGYFRMAHDGENAIMFLAGCAAWAIGIAIHQANADAELLEEKNHE